MGTLLALIPFRWWLYAGAGVALLTLAYCGVAKLEERGADKLQTQIDNQNRSAADAAANARSTRRACVDGGGRWDVTDGSCHAQ